MINQMRVFYILTLIVSALFCASCSEEKTMTLNEFKQVKSKMTIEGVNFDVPILYLTGGYPKNINAWPAPPQDELEGKRRPFDVLKFQALLPDLAHRDENNVGAFEVLGYGDKVSIYMKKHRVDKWQYYFEHYFKKDLIPLPESSAVPNMYRYREIHVNKRQIYFSDNKPSDKLVKITCANPELDPTLPPSPSCTVETVYRDHFDLELTFALKYLPQWREIDQKVQNLLDSFIASANSTQQQGQ